MRPASASAVTTGAECDATKQNDMSDSPANAEAETRDSTAASSITITSERSSTNCAGFPDNSSATVEYICELVSLLSPPVTQITVMLAGSRWTACENGLPCCPFTSPSLTDVALGVVNGVNQAESRPNIRLATWRCPIRVEYPPVPPPSWPVRFSGTGHPPSQPRSATSVEWSPGCGGSGERTTSCCPSNERGASSQLTLPRCVSRCAGLP